MKLRKRFLFIPVVLLTFSWLFYSAYSEVQKRTLHDFNSQQYMLAKQAGLGIESFFVYYQRELLFLSNLKYVYELNDQGKDLLEEFYTRHSDQIEAISFVDDKGVLRFTYPYTDSVIGKNISDQEHIRTVIETHKPTVSDVFTSVQGYRAIAYHIPLMVNDEYRGSLAILIPLKKLGQRYVETIRTGETGFGWMISEDGIELYHPNNSQIGSQVRETYREYKSVLDLIEKTLLEKEGTSISYLPSQSSGVSKPVKSISTFYRVSLGNTFWTILITTPESEVLSNMTSFRNRIYILFALVTLAMVIYFFLVLKATTVLKEDKRRKVLEAILKESEKRFRVMFELSPAGIILIDENGTIIEVNTSFCETLGYSRRELLTNNIRLFSAPDRDKEIKKDISEILSGKTLVHEVTDRKKNGSECVIALYETKILLPDGSPGILSVANDITEMKKFQAELIAAKEKAEESDRLKSAFLANMSHELRTPLNAIIGFSSLMSEITSDKEIIANSKIITDSGYHLLSLVEDILDTSMIEIGQVKVKIETVNIDSVLNEVKNIIEGEKLKENKTEINLISDIDESLRGIRIQTDSRKLKQILLNLLKNSLKFTDTGYIQFGFSIVNKAGADHLKFYVKDTGIGIDKKYHEVIFKIFRQIDDTHTRKFGGTGIGLSIASKLVELLGGEIWVESEPGKGSTFYFTVPYHFPPSP